MEIAELEPAPLERPAKLPLTTISPAGRRVHPPFSIGSGDLFASRAVVTPLAQEDW